MKSEVVFYSAVSVDGYIASFDKKNPVKWLDQFINEISDLSLGDEIKNSYSNFIDNVTVVIMGSKTYEDILSFDVRYPYQEMKNFVVTSKKRKKDINIHQFISINELIEITKNNKGKIYIVGGGHLVGQMIDHKLIDKIIMTQMPILLGCGVRFFQSNIETQLELLRVTHSGNFVELEYLIKK